MASHSETLNQFEKSIHKREGDLSVTCSPIIRCILQHLDHSHGNLWGMLLHLDFTRLRSTGFTLPRKYALYLFLGRLWCIPKRFYKYAQTRSFGKIPHYLRFDGFTFPFEGMKLLFCLSLFEHGQQKQYTTRSTFTTPELTLFAQEWTLYEEEETHTEGDMQY